MKWFMNISITQKMIALVGCLLILTFTVSAYSISKMKKVAVEIDAIANDNIPLAKLMTDMTVHQLEGAITLEKVFRAAGIESKEGKQQQERYEKELLDLVGSFKRDFTQVQQRLNKAIQDSTSPSIRKNLNNLKQDLDSLANEHGKFERNLDVLLNALRTGKEAQQLSELAHQLEQSQMTLDQQLSDILRKIEQATEQSVIVTEQEEQEAFWEWFT
ncbi:methyl-accepting chemotaxis protein [Vibrio mimicus]|nr:methyl-accepting chemotaxis protein [Vibrio mimicus]